MLNLRTLANGHLEISLDQGDPEFAYLSQDFEAGRDTFWSLMTKVFDPFASSNSFTHYRDGKTARVTSEMEYSSEGKKMPVGTVWQFHLAHLTQEHMARELLKGNPVMYTRVI